jgi:hypothetical protein
MSNDAENYELLLKRFTQNEMSAEAFQTAYINIFKNETRQFDESVFGLLDALFGDVDAFCADPKLRAELDAQTPGFYLDEAQLRQRATVAYERLLSLQQNENSDTEKH